MGRQELDELCGIQAEITKMEAELNNVEEIGQIFDIEVLMELPQKLVVERTAKKENNTVENVVNRYHTIYPDGLLKKFDERKTTELPNRLIDISQVEEGNLRKLKVKKVRDLINSGAKIENYAILSYS